MLYKLNFITSTYLQENGVHTNAYKHTHTHIHIHVHTIENGWYYLIHHVSNRGLEIYFLQIQAITLLELSRYITHSSKELNPESTNSNPYKECKLWKEYCTVNVGNVALVNTVMVMFFCTTYVSFISTKGHSFNCLGSKMCHSSSESQEKRTAHSDGNSWEGFMYKGRHGTEELQGIMN